MHEESAVNLFANRCQALLGDQRTVTLAALVAAVESIPTISTPAGNLVIAAIVNKTAEVILNRSGHTTADDELRTALLGLCVHGQTAASLRQSCERLVAAIPAQGRFDERITRVLALLEEVYRDPNVRLVTIAHRAAMSSGHLTRFMKQETGKTVVDHLRAVRCRHAHRLLVSTSRSVKEISYDTGFTSAAEFIRQFRRVYGMTPGHLRRAAHGAVNDAPVRVSRRAT
jgi:transcriptional regulator GlxA family with amidase domain